MFNLHPLKKEPSEESVQLEKKEAGMSKEESANCTECGKKFYGKPHTLVFPVRDDEIPAYNVKGKLYCGKCFEPLFFAAEKRWGYGTLTMEGGVQAMWFPSVLEEINAGEKHKPTRSSRRKSNARRRDRKND